MQKVTRNPKMHVVVLENDVDYVKNSFESIFEMLELFYREKDLCDILYR